MQKTELHHCKINENWYNAPVGQQFHIPDHSYEHMEGKFGSINLLKCTIQYSVKYRGTI